jgi:sialate O-acetylesterase
MKRHAVVCLLLCVCFYTAKVAAEVRMPQIFSDHMVLQRDMPVRIWGWADPSEHITVTLGKRHVSTVAGLDGKWQVQLKKMSANAASQALTVHGRNTVTFTDVLVGDVWVCSGQSNMERLLEQTMYSDADLASAQDSQLRLFHVLPATAITPQEDVHRWDGQPWKPSTSERALKFSAVAFFFGRELRRHLGIPIGLIDSTKGGTRVQLWTGVDAIRGNLDADPEFRVWLQRRDDLVQHLTERTEGYPEKKAQYDQKLAFWEKQVNNDPNYVEAMKRWQSALELAQQRGTEWPTEPKPPQVKPTEPPEPDDGPYSTFMVGNLFNAMIAPLTQSSIKGVIWYQGETNDKNPPQYKVLFPLLIEDWRQHWKEGNFPFLFVQLPNIHRPQTQPVQDSDPWPWMREAQKDALSLPNTAMAVTIDIGDPWNVHGKDKRDIGIRLSLLARKQVYGEDLVAEGPTFKAMHLYGSEIELTFDGIGKGLTLGVPPWAPAGVIPKPASEARGFAITGEDRRWHWGEASIEGNKIVVWSPQVDKPVAVRYGWSDNPPCNLYNLEGLPAAPFRTDDWERSADTTTGADR